MNKPNRQSVSLPKYRKHKASGRAIVTLNGKDIYLGVHGSRASKQEYDRIVGEWQINGRIFKPNADSITIAELIRRYLKFAEGYYVKNGNVTNEFSCLKSAVRPLYEKYRRTAVDEFGPISLEAVRNRMIELNWSRGFINICVGRIRRMFRWGVTKEIVPVTVYQSLATLDGLKQGKSKARETGPVLPVPDEVVERTLEHAKPICAAMIRLQRLTGMRPGEVCDLRPCDIDRSGDVWIFRQASHKMQHKGRGRVIPIGPRGQDVLRPYLLRESASYCFENADGGREAYLCHHERRWESGDFEEGKNECLTSWRIWLDYPESIGEIMGELPIELVIAQIDRAMEAHENGLVISQRPNNPKSIGEITF